MRSNIPEGHQAFSGELPRSSRDVTRSGGKAEIPEGHIALMGFRAEASQKATESKPKAEATVEDGIPDGGISEVEAALLTMPNEGNYGVLGTGI